MTVMRFRRELKENSLTACGFSGAQAMPGVGVQPGEYRFGIHTMPGRCSGPLGG